MFARVYKKFALADIWEGCVVTAESKKRKKC